MLFQCVKTGSLEEIYKGIRRDPIQGCVGIPGGLSEFVGRVPIEALGSESLQKGLLRIRKNNLMKPIVLQIRLLAGRTDASST